MELPALPGGEEPPRRSLVNTVYPAAFSPSGLCTLRLRSSLEEPLTREEVSRLREETGAEIAGILLPNDEFSDGETPVHDMISWYAEEARRLMSAGVSSLWLEGCNSLWHARAALLGARKTGLPTLVTLEMGDNGETRRGDDPLGCLLCLQALGAAAFGLHAERPSHLFGVFNRLLPYSGIPLMASADGDGGASGSGWAEEWKPLFNEGVRIAAEGKNTSTQDLQALRGILSGYHERVGTPPRPEDAPLLLTGGAEVYFLEEDFSLSEPIPCDLDMLEYILEWEDQAVDALLFEIDSVEEAEAFAEHIHMARNAVCIRCDDETLLEYCLVEYGGLALIDSRSQVDETAMQNYAARYGAAIR